MAKKLVAVTGIKHNGTTYEAGETLPAAEFTKDELKELHDNGALTIVDDTKIEDVKEEKESEKSPATSPSITTAPATSAGPDTSAPAKETPKK